MIIHALSVKDFKGVKDIRLQDLKAGLIIVTGKNGQGKSSLLDAIEQGLRGGKAVCGKPIRNGSVKAEIQFDLGELEVKRTFKEGKAAKVTVRNKKARTTAGQQVLNMLLNARTMDPTTFLHLKEKDQAAELQKALGLDFSAIDGEVAEVYEQRRDVNRDLDAARAALEAMPHHDDAPEHEYSLLDLTGELSDIRALQGKVDNAGKQADSIKADWVACCDEIDELKARLAELEGARDKLAEQQDKAAAEHKNQAALLAKCRPLETIEEQINNAEENNQKARDNKARAKKAAEVAGLEKETGNLSARLGDLRTKREKMLQKADCPVDGLAITDDGVSLQGVPLEQCSQAEQLRIGFEVARLINPELKVICCREGSNLDDDAVKFLADLAASHEYQFWLEMVRTDEDDALEIIEGELA